MIANPSATNPSTSVAESVIPPRRAGREPVGKPTVGPLFRDRGIEEDGPLRDGSMLFRCPPRRRRDTRPSETPSTMGIDRDELLAAPDWEDATFADLDCGGLDLSGKAFRQCVFERVRLAEARLVGATFEDCEIESCDLTMARVEEAAFRSVSFRRTKLMGIDWSGVRGIAFVVSFEGCTLSYGTFVDLKMQATVFRDCKAHEVSFIGVDLTKCVFPGTDLAGARFMDTVLVEADLSDAVNYRISPQQNRLKRTKFSEEAALAVVAELGVIVPRR
jgi:fluoroquinolone resistance protein